MTNEPESEKKYPEYDPYDIGDEECWERYAKKIKELKKERQHFRYPLDKNSHEFVRYGLHKSMVVKMTPEEFLKLSLPKTHVRTCSLDYLFDAYWRGKPKLDPLYLRVDSSVKKIDYDDPKMKKKCPIISHEGRHRAEIAMDLGIKKVPVLIDYAPDYTLKGYDEIREFDKKRQDPEWKGNYYNLSQKLMKDKWVPPNTCSIKNLKPEQVSFMYGQKEPLWKTREKWHKLRKKYGLNKNG